MNCVTDKLINFISPLPQTWRFSNIHKFDVVSEGPTRTGPKILKNNNNNKITNRTIAMAHKKKKENE